MAVTRLEPAHASAASGKIAESFMVTLWSLQKCLCVFADPSRSSEVRGEMDGGKDGGETDG